MIFETVMHTLGGAYGVYGHNKELSDRSYTATMLARASTFIPDYYSMETFNKYLQVINSRLLPDAILMVSRTLTSNSFLTIQKGFLYLLTICSHVIFLILNYPILFLARWLRWFRGA